MPWGHETRRRLLGGVAALGLGGRASDERPTTGDDRRRSATDDHHLLVAGGSAADPVRYAFAVDGTVARTGTAGPAPLPDERVSVDPDDRVVDGSRVEGGVAGGADAYRFTGDLVRFSAEVTAGTEDRIAVYLDGAGVRPADLSGAASSAVTFLDCATARIPAGLDTDGTGEVGVSTMGPVGIDTHIFGLPEDGGVYRPDVDAPAVALDSVTYTGSDGDRRYAANPYAGPWCLEYLLVIAGGSPRAPARYEFSTRRSIRRTDEVGDAPVSRATVDADDVVTAGDSGATARGAVAGGADAYYLNGELTAFRLDGDATVYVGGERVPADELDSG